MTSPADPAAVTARQGATAGRSRRRLVVALAIVLGLTVALAGLAILLLSMRALQDSRSARASLLADGGRGTATITAVSRPGGELCGLVDARFAESGGRTVTVTNLEISPGARPGGTFEVRYDRSDPTRFEVVRGCGDPHGEWRYWLAAATAVLVLVAEVVLIAIWLVVVGVRARREVAVVSR